MNIKDSDLYHYTMQLADFLPLNMTFNATLFELPADSPLYSPDVLFYVYMCSSISAMTALAYISRKQIKLFVSSFTRQLKKRVSWKDGYEDTDENSLEDVKMCQISLDTFKPINNEVIKLMPDDANEVEQVVDEKISSDYNHVYFHAAVNVKNINRVLKELQDTQRYCEKMMKKLNIETIPIYLHINSYGGNVVDGSILIDYIMASKIPIYSIAEGVCMSMAAYFSIFCKKRYILPSTTIMIHQMTLGRVNRRRLVDVNEEVKHELEFDKKQREMFLKYTKIPENKLKKYWRKDKYFTAEKALKYGLVDEIIT